MNSPCGAPILWGISPDFSGLSPCYRWIAYVLLTRAPVADRGIATSPLPLDLHVLGLSLAFILSQDQTLRCIISFFYNSIENFAFSPSKGAARDSPVLTLTFLLVSYYFVYHSLKDLSLFSSPLLSQCVSVIPEKRVQR